MSRGRPGAAHIHDGGHCHRVSYEEGQRARAVRWVASHARDAQDAAQLLDALGLSGSEGVDR